MRVDPKERDNILIWLIGQVWAVIIPKFPLFTKKAESVFVHNTFNWLFFKLTNGQQTTVSVLAHFYFLLTSFELN